MARLPHAGSLPCGTSQSGLPIGAQLIRGAKLQKDLGILLACLCDYEIRLPNVPHHRIRPPGSGSNRLVHPYNCTSGLRDGVSERFLDVKAGGTKGR